jgi:hypothetical protein
VRVSTVVGCLIRMTRASSIADLGPLSSSASPRATPRIQRASADDNFGFGLIDPLKALQLVDPRTATTVPPSLAPPLRMIRQR